MQMTSFITPKFRKHPLSFIPGGCIILVTDKRGDTRIYDKIKYPEKYIHGIFEKNMNGVTTIYVDNLDGAGWILCWTRDDQYKKAA